MKALNFNGSGVEYFKIWIVNILLTIITLGLYYPWAKVRNNRYFYANSELEQRSFDYHATGKQLFFGYLIAMGILILYIVIQTVSPVGSILVIVAMFLAFPWIIWRSFKFNMRMTSFSNVRFGFEAGLGQAYINYMLLPLALLLIIYGIPVAIFTAIAASDEGMSSVMGAIIGFASVVILPLLIFVWAYMKKRNAHYALNGIRYGQGEFATQVETAGFATILLKTFGLAILLLVGTVVIVSLLTMLGGVSDQLVQAFGQINNPEEMDDSMGLAVGLTVTLVYIGFIFVFMLLIAYSYSRQRRYIFENTRLDERIEFSSTLGARSMAWVMITNFLAIIFSLGLALPWAKVRMARLILENSLVDTELGFDEYLTQQQEHQSSLGDQIGDAFDLDVGIGI